MTSMPATAASIRSVSSSVRAVRHHAARTSMRLLNKRTSCVVCGDDGTA